jgi:DNA-binding SARP family transcriptional activator
MQVRLLGPVDVVVGGVARPVQGLRRTAILAALALQPGEIVAATRVVEMVWGDTPPAAAGPTLQSHVSHLRRALGEQSAILARPPGYVLHVDEPTDLQTAERLVAEGTAHADPSRAAGLLQAAVALWRGPALAELTTLPWFAAQAQRLEHLFEQAHDGLVDARLSLGQHAHLIGELQTLVDEQPHRESSYRQLMLALYRSGRQGDALAVYQRLRLVLDNDLGIAPSQPLRDLETAILRQDPTLDPPPPVRAAAPLAAVPAQLPPVVASFTGRADELRQLDDILARAHAGEPGSGHPSAVVVSAVSGTAGIGKTTLAVHWAQRNAAQFPDGQLYVNLRGFDPGGSAVEPAEAVVEFLGAFATGPRRPVSQSRGRQTGAGRVGQRARRWAGPAAAAGLARLPGHRHQSQYARAAGGHRGRSPDHARSAHPRRSP